MPSGKAFVRTILAGDGARIVAALDVAGNCPADDFIVKLSKERPNDFRKIQALLRLASEIGPHRIGNEEKVKKVDGELFEFKSHQIRIFWCYGPGSGGTRTVVLLTGVIKKRDKHKKQDLVAARNLLAIYEENIR